MKEIVTQITYLGPSKLFSNSYEPVAIFTAKENEFLNYTYTDWECKLHFDKDSKLQEVAELISTFFNSPNGVIAKRLSLQIYGQKISLQKSTQNNTSDYYLGEIISSLKLG